MNSVHTDLENMFLSNKVLMVEHILGQQRCTGPDKQAICHINHLSVKILTFNRQQYKMKYFWQVLHCSAYCRHRAHPKENHVEAGMV